MSCKELISIGAPSLEFDRYRGPITDIEERIHGEGVEIQIASFYMCASCGEIFLNLNDIGYCLDITQDMRKDIKEYHRITGFLPQK